MSAFLYGARLQWKAAVRNFHVLVTFYIVPLLYFAVFGGIFVSVLPDGKATLLQMMTVFSISMGALIGLPLSVMELYRPAVRGTFGVNGVPVWQGLVQLQLAGALHLLILSGAIWVLAPVCFEAALPASPVCFLTGLLLLIAASLGIASVTGLAVRDASMVSAVSVAVFLPSILLSGIMFPANLLPPVLLNAGAIFPTTWAFRLMCSSELMWTDVYPLLLIVAACAAALAVLLRRLRQQ